jgi:hypothetical protein
MLVPAFWYAGRPIGFGVPAFLGAIWRYTAAALVAGLATAAIIQGGLLWGPPASTAAAFAVIVIVSILFAALYLVVVILFHGGLAPLRQLGSLLSELAPSRKASTPMVEVAAKVE